ncbi:hypothetical protein G6F22_021356 [Rhizopus arrhizus]|nr:hypothetical protein G6F22_021356 [Rhizopus arrhizus]
MALDQLGALPAGDAAVCRHRPDAEQRVAHRIEGRRDQPAGATARGRVEAIIGAVRAEEGALARARGAVAG